MHTQSQPRQSSRRSHSRIDLPSLPSHTFHRVVSPIANLQAGRNGRRGGRLSFRGGDVEDPQRVGIVTSLEIGALVAGSIEEGVWQASLGAVCECG